MFCPECGAEAGAANYCPECGTELKGPAASPDCVECGSELPEGARFCPECGEPAAGAAPAAAPAAGGRRTGTRGRSAGAGQQRRQQPRAQQAAPASGKTAAARQPGRISPAKAWGILAAVVAVAIVVVVLVAGGSGGDPGAEAAPTAPQPAQSVPADTSGGYAQLVQRANGLYDQGAAELQSEHWDQAAAYFLAASKVYAAAWAKQSTDPGVGTDFATSLFYSGDVDGAIAQVEKVLAASADFQTAWFNKGNYFSQRARQAEQAGQQKDADRDYAAARSAYQKAVDLDPASASGQSAKEQLGQLPD